MHDICNGCMLVLMLQQRGCAQVSVIAAAKTSLFWKVWYSKSIVVPHMHVYL